MKRILAIMLTVCMVLTFVPVMSFAAETTITSATTAFFTSSSALATVEGSGESNSSCVLVAWNHSDNWNAANDFTDTDGTVTSQTVTSGTAFGSSRQAVISFNIPSDFDADSVTKVTLGLTVRYVKQIGQAGARLAIYGNSVSGTWTTSSDKSIFGVNGADSGTSKLQLLGLTSPINSAGDKLVDQEVTLSSLALTKYVKDMANEGKTQVTFRIAVPYGGVWIYNSASSHPATLKVAKSKTTSANAVRTAFFNSSGSEWKETDNTTGSDNVLVSTGATGWEAASSFTDTDGTVTNQPSLNGTNFGSARHALVAFAIPEGFDPDNTSKVTLGLTVKNVKQVSAGARLAVYGNSVAGSWSVSDAMSKFGVSGTNSGLTNLTLLGLTDAIVAGNKDDEVASGQTITLSSQKLTEYVCQMAKEGKTEVTFRLAAPLGGIRIYDAKTNTPPTLKIEEGTITTVTIKTVYMDGNKEVSSSEKTISNILAGSTYTYSGKPAYTVEVNGSIYTYSLQDSTLSTVAKSDGSGQIVLVYNKYDDSQNFSGYEIDDEGAWCWFADPRSISYANDEGTLDFSIIGYIDTHGSIKATQINHLTDEVNEVLIRSNIQPDDHNNPTFLVLPDERIVVFYSRHTDENCFWYRVTEEKGDLTTLGEEKCLSTKDPTTYPSPFIMEDDPDHIYLMWRGINWHPTCARLTMPDENGNMSFDVQPFQVVQSTAQGSGCRPYAKYASDGKGKIYMTYTSTHPDNIYPVSIYYSCLDVTNFTLYDINGGVLKANVNTAGPFTVNGSETDSRFVVDPTSTSQRGWVWQIAISEDGKPVIAMVRINQAKNNHDYYYAKWNGTEWVKTFLANGGTSFHQSTSAGLELCYSGGMAIDPDNTNVIYCSVPVEGVFGKVYEIIKYTMNDNGTQVVATEQITMNSTKNNVRPFVIPNSEGKDIRLTWMHGDYYDWIVSKDYTTKGYCTAIHAEAALPTKNVNLNNAVATEDYDSIGGAYVSKAGMGDLIEVTPTDEFSVSADIYLGEKYEGKLLDLGSVEVSVKTMNTQYGATQKGDRARVVVTVDGVDYATSNVYGSSDCWTAFNRGTGGNYGIENYKGYINHIITYDGEYLTLYREGLVDFKLKVENLTLKNVIVGGFDGLADNVAVFDRVINHDEIKALASVDDAVKTPGATDGQNVVVSFVDTKGNTIKADETVTLTAGSDYYLPADTIRTDNGEYELSEEDCVFGNGKIKAVYVKTKAYGENLISGFDALTNAKDGGKLDKWVVVNKSTLDPSLTGQYIHRTGDNTGGTGDNTMRTFVPIEGGKTYIVTNTIYNKTGAATTNNGTAGMSAIIAAGDSVYGTFAGLKLYSDIDNGGVTSWTNTNSDVTWIGSASARNDITTVPGENKIEYIINTPKDAKTIMISYGAHGNNELYYGDFAVREVMDPETVNITFDGKKIATDGTFTLGENGQLPENVIGYYVTSGENLRFVNAGNLLVNDGDIIETVFINVKMVTGAQVRYGGGLDEEGKIGSGNGLRFIAQVDRSSVDEDVTGYGVNITAEGSSESINIPATMWQDGDAQTIFTAALTNIAVSNYNREFTATPYVNVKYADGTEATIYGTETITRSVYQVAIGLLKNSSDKVDGNDSNYDTSNYGLYDVLNAYVNMVGIRLNMTTDGNFTARTNGTGAYTSDLFFDVTSEKNADGTYKITVTPIASFNNKVTIMSYWNEFVRINNNHTQVADNISNSVINSDGSVTFTFKLPN